MVWTLLPAAHVLASTGAAPAKLMVIVMENASRSSIIGNSSLPYINSLAQDYVDLTNNYATAHPSLPDYLELTSASTWGVGSDCAPGGGCQGGSASLLAQLDSADISWAGYMEDMPSVGYTGGDTGGDDGYGNQLYQQHHNPFVYYPTLAGEMDRVKPLTSMLGDLGSSSAPDFVFVAPNMVDDMHDGPLSVGDKWLSQEIPAIQSTPWYTSGGTVLVEFDEGDASDSAGINGTAGGQVPGILVSQALRGRGPYSSTVDQAGIVASMEAAWGLPAINDATDPANGSLGSLLAQPTTTTSSGSSPPAPTSGSPPSATAAAPSNDPSGQGLPATPDGYTPVCLDDFTADAATGSWGTSDAGQVVYTGDRGCRWTEYPDGGPSTYTSGQPGYQPAQVLSVHSGVLDFFLHNVNELPSGANPSPVLSTGSQYQTYGSYSVRAQVVYGDSSKLDDYHIAWLLWPQNDNDWQSAESDFPEADLGDSQVCAYTHRGGSGLQDSFCTPIDFTKWHTYTQVWGPGFRSYYVDGVLVGTSTAQVWSGPERWQLQTEPSGKNDGGSGHVLVDWVAVYAPCTCSSAPTGLAATSDPQASEPVADPSQPVVTAGPGASTGSAGSAGPAATAGPPGSAGAADTRSNAPATTSVPADPTGPGAEAPSGTANGVPVGAPGGSSASLTSTAAPALAFTGVSDTRLVAGAGALLALAGIAGRRRLTPGGLVGLATSAAGLGGARRAR